MENKIVMGFWLNRTRKNAPSKKKIGLFLYTELGSQMFMMIPPQELLICNTTVYYMAE